MGEQEEVEKVEKDSRLWKTGQWQRGKLTRLTTKRVELVKVRRDPKSPGAPASTSRKPLSPHQLEFSQHLPHHFPGSPLQQHFVQPREHDQDCAVQRTSKQFHHAAKLRNAPCEPRDQHPWHGGNYQAQSCMQPQQVEACHGV